MKVQKMRPQRKQQPTPKGAAERSLVHTKELLCSLDINPNEKESFIHQFNDFLRDAHTVIEFLPKENGRAPGLKAWFKRELDLLTDARFAYFLHLRTVSEHDCIVEPGSSQSAEEFTDLTLCGSMEAEVKDRSGKTLARVSQAAPPNVESSVRQSTGVSVKYFLREWPEENIIDFCKAVVATLDGLVASAYRAYP
jgi:hypothetical protein